LQHGKIPKCHRIIILVVKTLRLLTPSVVDIFAEFYFDIFAKFSFNTVDNNIVDSTPVPKGSWGFKTLFWKVNKQLLFWLLSFLQLNSISLRFQFVRFVAFETSNLLFRVCCPFCVRFFYFHVRQNEPTDVSASNLSREWHAELPSGFKTRSWWFLSCNVQSFGFLAHLAGKMLSVCV